MSIENAKAFYEKVMTDKNLFNQIGQVRQDDPGGLEAVAGGKSGKEIYHWVINSIFSAGIACAVSGIVNALTYPSFGKPIAGISLKYMYILAGFWCFFRNIHQRWIL